MAGLDTPPVKLLGVADAPEGSAFSKSSVGSAAIPAIPKPEDPYKRREWQLEHMAAAFRFFARKGFTDGLYLDTSATATLLTRRHSGLTRELKPAQNKIPAHL